MCIYNAGRKNAMKIQGTGLTKVEKFKYLISSVLYIGEYDRKVQKMMQVGWTRGKEYLD